LAVAASPLLIFAELQRFLPKMGLANNEIGRAALKLALSEAERFPQPRYIGIGPAQKSMLATNTIRRSAYIYAATKRSAEALAEAARNGTTREEAIAEIRSAEDRYFNQHVAADYGRTEAGNRIDALASTHGTVLGWYSHDDDRTTPECREANGKNFLASAPPDIGYPGVVHVHCRCQPGPPHAGAPMLPGPEESAILAASNQRRGVREYALASIVGQLRQRRRVVELAATPDHEHIPGTAYHYRHGWQPLAGSQSNYVTRADDKRKRGGQTKSNFVDPDTGEAMSKSSIGDTYEELFRAHGAHLLAKKFGGPYIAISHAEGETGLGARNTPLDFHLDHKYGGELKTLSAKAKNQKTAIKADEVARKYTAVRQAGVAPLLIVQVVDQETNTITVYAFPQFASKHVAAMEQIGSYSYTNDNLRQAQKKMGYRQ
jgi:hypothetical protein